MKPGQFDFEPDGAHARRTDPGTSHAAARALRDSDRLGDLQATVIAALDCRPMTIWEASHHAGVEIHSLSPRFATLADKGWIRPTGETRKNPQSNRQAIVWERTPAGDVEAAAAARRAAKTGRVCPTCGAQRRG